MAEKVNKEKEQKAAEGRKQALQNALANIEKHYGKGSVMRFGEKVESNSTDAIPTGALSLDLALGVGGVPRGRIIEIYGPESSGKTTVTLHIVAEVQKRGGTAAFIDAEHALDPVYAKNIGVNIDELFISQPDDGEQALEIADEMVRSGAIDIIVIDSVAALVPRAEINGEMGDSHVGLHARLMSQALRKLTAVSSKNDCMIIFTNQLREKIGISYGNPETTTGGRALKFYASVRLDIRKADALKQGDKIIGNRTKVKVAKNKVAPPFRIAEFDIMFGEGISREGDVLDLAVERSVVSKSGSWYGYNETRIGQGRENAKQYLKENPDMLAEIENRVRELNGLPAKDNNAMVFAGKEVDESADKRPKKAEKGKKAKDTKPAKAEETDELDDEEIDSIIDELGLGEDAEE